MTADLRALTRTFGPPGRLQGIVLRPSRTAPAAQFEQVQALVGLGLAGDRASAKPPEFDTKPPFRAIFGSRPQRNQ